MNDLAQHKGVRCDGCTKNDWLGSRYKCSSCFDYDLCGDCYASKRETKNHKSFHSMYAVAGKLPLYESIQAFIKSKGFKVLDSDAQKSQVLLVWSAEEAGINAYVVSFRAIQEQEAVVISCVLPRPNEKKTEMIEYFTLANRGLLLGNFTFDASDGEVRYQMVMDTKGFLMSQLLINFERSFGICQKTFVKYAVGIKSVEKGTSPEVVIAAIEA